MPKPRELRRRIRAVQNTRKITKTMEMVATSRLKRAQDRLEAARPYARALAETIGRLLTPELVEQHPLLRQPQARRRAAVLLLTSNRGLAGAFNTNLIREARALIDRLRGEGLEVELHVVGKKGVNFFRFRGEPMATARVDIGDRPTPDDAIGLADPLIEAYGRGGVDAVYVVQAHLKSLLATPPQTRPILPVSPPEGGAVPREYLLEPDARAILDRLLPLYVRNQIFLALVETAAAEQAARRIAMKNATDNADELLRLLVRTYNRARQAQITQEIAEIVGGAAALD